MRTRHRLLAALTAWLTLVVASPAFAQAPAPTSTRPRPWSRVSFYLNSARDSVTGIPTQTFTELSTAFAFQIPEADYEGAEYGVDVRYDKFTQVGRPDRTAIYEGFVGARVMGGRLRARAGHLYLTDIGSLGQVAGVAAEYRQPRATRDGARIRAGLFGGLEPNILDSGYASGVKKFGAYVAYDGKAAQRSSLGYVAVRDSSLTERSVLTTTNFVPVSQKLFIYQAAEVNLSPPDGVGRSGLAYLFSNVRLTPTDKLELQGTYNRGRSVDTRGLADDVLNGRPVTQLAVDGLLFESVGGRVTVEVAPRIRVYAGVSNDKNNRDAASTRRLLFGGHAANLLRSGFDLSASDSLMDRPTGSYHSSYVSLGKQIGRRAYASIDYSTSLSVIRFSRSDGILIETRPHTTRVSGALTMNLTRVLALLANLEHTSETDFGEVRVLTGLTYRFR